jgi:hypothetical protein
LQNRCRSVTSLIALMVLFWASYGTALAQQPMSLGVNLQGPAYYSYEQPFINNMLMASDWFGFSKKPPTDPAGYPTAMAGNTQICTQMLYNYTFSGQYFVIKYSGDRAHPIADAGTIVKLGYGTGTIIDKTPGRLILQAGTGAGILGICISADDPKGTGNYIRNIAVIDCEKSATNCANEKLWDNCGAVNHACLSPTWETAFGTRNVGGPGFTSYRFMDWMHTETVTEGDWAKRSAANFFSYVSESESTGVPLEVIFSVLNRTCADGWINIPAAAIKIANDGTFSGAISGTTLTVSGLEGNIRIGDYLTWPGTKVPGIYVVASLGGGQYTVSQSVRQSNVSMKASYVDTTYIQNMATLAQQQIKWCNATQKLRVEVGNEPWNFTPHGYNFFGDLAQSLWGVGGVDGGFSFRGMIAAIAGNIFKTTFASDSGHIQAVLCVQPIADTNYATAGGKLLIAPYWSGFPAYMQIDALTIADYYTIGEYNMPYAWLSLPDGGLSKLHAEIATGGQVNNQVSKISQTSGSGYGSCGKNCSYIPVTDANNRTALCNFAVTNGALNCELSNGGENFAKGDTLTVNNSHFGGTGSGWTGTIVEVTGPDPHKTGALSEVNAVVAIWQKFAQKYNLQLLGYEGGQQLLLAHGESPMMTLLCAWDAYSGAKSVTYDLLDFWRMTVGPAATFNYYTDTSQCGYPSSWGLALEPHKTSTGAKYQGAVQQLR